MVKITIKRKKGNKETTRKERRKNIGTEKVDVVCDSIRACKQPNANNGGSTADKVTISKGNNKSRRRKRRILNGEKKGVCT